MNVRKSVAKIARVAAGSLLVLAFPLAAMADDANATTAEGPSLKESAKEVGHGVKNGAVAVGHGVKEGAVAVGHAAKTGAQAVGEGARKVGHAVGQAYRDVKEELTGKSEPASDKASE